MSSGVLRVPSVCRIGGERRQAGGREKGPVARAVGPLGTVVEAAGTPVTSSRKDIDAPAVSNDDEAAFRPVVHAPSAPPHTPLLVRPLPCGTTIPVQTASQRLEKSPENEPEPLKLDVVIPAELTAPCMYRVDSAFKFEDYLEESSENVTVFKDLNKSINLIENVCVKEEECRLEVSSELKVNDDNTLPKLSSASAGDMQAEKASIRIKKSPTPKSFSENVVKDDSSFKELKDINQSDENSAEVTIKIPRTKAKDNSQKLKSEDKLCKDSQSVLKENKKDDFMENKQITSNNDKKMSRKKVENQKDNIMDNKITPLKCREPEVVNEVEFSVPDTNIVPEIISESVTIKEKNKNVKVDIDNSNYKSNKEKKNFKDKDKCEDSDTIVASVNLKSKESTKSKNKKHKTLESFEMKDDIEIITEQPHFTDLKSIIASENIERELIKDRHQTPKLEEIKTEQQAWDLLMNEHDVTVPTISVQTTEKNVQDKPKSKRNRKSKYKPFDDVVSNKTEEDSFVEIHNIIDNQPTSSSDLVSISTGYEDTLFKPKHNKCKSQPFENENDGDVLIKSPMNLESNDSINTCDKNISTGQLNIDSKTDKVSNILKGSVASLDVHSDFDFYLAEETAYRSRKTKSASPFYERSSTLDKLHTDTESNVIIIDSTKEDFPQIQITKGKGRKKTTVDMNFEEVEVLDKPIKSWSSITASKSGKSSQEGGATCLNEAKVDIEYSTSSKTVSLQDKLVELCKRRDIMVAECDAPSELKFFEDHHVMRELPPLESPDFGLDEFKLEVMRDSLLEAHDDNVVSPICKINIDDILSSIKDTTNKAIESSAFGHLTLEKMTLPKEDVDYEKITSREIDSGEEDPKQKSSDEDNSSPMASQTDSDKDDKRGAGGGGGAGHASSRRSKANKSRKKKKLFAF